MKQTLQLRLSQHLTLTPQLQQSIRLLQLSTVELNQEIERILMENPAIEREDSDAPAAAFGNDAGSAPAADAPPAGSADSAPETGPSDWEPDFGGRTGFGRASGLNSQMRRSGFAAGASSAAGASAAAGRSTSCISAIGAESPGRGIIFRMRV